jgi:hypothetical protein
MEKMLCFKCKWYVGELACPAYPAGIPERILLGTDGHREIERDQLGNFVFTDKTKTEKDAGIRS